MTTYRFEQSRVGVGWTLRRDGKAIGILYDRTTTDERTTILAALQERASTHGQPRGMDRLAKLDRIEALMRQIDAEDDVAECDRLWGELLGAIDS